MITQKELKEHLYYEPKTGIFTWIRHFGGATSPGKIAGCLHKENGYIQIQINRNQIYAHRLAYLYVYGFLPEHNLDHINRNKTDNRISNLREASHQCNAINCGISKNNTSGIKGVSWHKYRKKWVAQIKFNMKGINMGDYETIGEAAKVRWNAEVKYKFPNCNTTSTAYRYLKKHNLI